MWQTPQGQVLRIAKKTRIPKTHDQKIGTNGKRIIKKSAHKTTRSGSPTSCPTKIKYSKRRVAMKTVKLCYGIEAT